MASCQACGTEILGRDRFCRNCGAPVAISVGDLTDTSRFQSETDASANQNAPVFREPTNPFHAPSAPGYAAPHFTATPPYNTSSLTRFIRAKALWLVFLLVLLFGAVGAGAFLLARTPLDSIDAIIEQDGEKESTRQAYEEAVQNSLGFKQGTMSDSEFPGIKGIFVNSLMSDDCPAALAKIEAGDVLLELNSNPVRNNTELSQALTPLTPGQEVPIKFYRDGETKTTTLKVADRSFPPLQPKIDARYQGFLGILDSNRRCCVPGAKKWGVEVLKTHYNAPAELFGLQPGDVITKFDGHATRTASEFNRRIRSTKPRSKVLVTFYRGASEQTIEVIMGHRW